MLRHLVAALALLNACVQAAPALDDRRSVQFDKRGGSMPTVKFADATYRATKYDSVQDIYTFSNIRFAAPPLGKLRWQKPAPPLKNSTIQDGSYGNACPQAQANGLNFFGKGSDLPVGNAFDDFVNYIAKPFESGGAEDCLFLDVYVPGNAVRNPSGSKLPVVHWFYGGGYVLGHKNQLQPALPFYDGSGLIDQSEGNIIFVGSNYRLGAFGFMAGTTMEKEGLPNTGLWDQRAALQWTKDNIHLLGGDPDEITAMGESAGASSLLHHLVMDGGKMKPVFKRVIMQSPAFLPMFDRAGVQEDVFQQFARLAGCATPSVECLRSKDTETLLKANDVLNGQAPDGSFMFGASADGKLIRQTPALEFASGNYYKDLESLIVSHTSDESDLFVNGNVRSDEDLVNFLEEVFPKFERKTLIPEILNYYPSPDAENSPYGNEGDRLRAIVRDSSFTCPTRYLSDAYTDQTYNMQYSITPGWHAVDLLPTFWSHGLSGSPLGDALELAMPLMTAFASVYKAYLTSFIRTGDPNVYRKHFALPIPIDWPTADASGEQIQNVLNAGDLGLSIISDETNQRTPCEFWRNFLAAGAIAGGYVPPGAAVPNPFLNATSSMSGHFKGGNK